MMNIAVKDFLYTLVYNFPNITSRKIHQLAWIYQNTYSNLSLHFDWDDGYCEAPTIEQELQTFARHKVIFPHRPHRGKPRYAFRWTVWASGFLGLKSEWPMEVLETFKYYNRDENDQELKIKTIELRIRTPSFDAIHRDTRASTKLKLKKRYQRGGRTRPVKRERKREVNHNPRN